MHLNNFDIGVFLSDFWQKKPLLIKNPWGAWRNPLEPDELAGLACEDDMESRLIVRKRDSWKVEHGPIPETRFAKLGKKPWTLLVQAVDHHVPEVAALIEPFRFIPNWRIDDVMVSYASDGGGVGPHFDQYDVFLIQGLGKRLWQVGGHCDVNTELLPHDDLRLLGDFEATEEWLLEPGDILYVPPGIAHNGVAVGDDCMTYSIGFRAPSRSELIAHWCDHLLAEMEEDDRYADPDLQTQENPGEISAQAIAKLHTMITQKMGDREAFARWFGEYTTTAKYPDTDWAPEEPIQIEELRKRLATGEPLHRNPASRFSFVRLPNRHCEKRSNEAIQNPAQETGLPRFARNDGNGSTESPHAPVLLFVDGECFECVGESSAFAEMLYGQGRITIDPDLMKSDSTMTLISTLFNQGSVAFDRED